MFTKHLKQTASIFSLALLSSGVLFANTAYACSQQAGQCHCASKKMCHHHQKHCGCASKKMCHHQSCQCAAEIEKDAVPIYIPASHWYVGANLGLSNLHDNPNKGSGNTVHEFGPGGSVVAGYQFNPMWGAELGYTQYYNSREMAGNFIFAKTTHFAVDLAATAQYPFLYRINALGKLGIAYNYAQKMITASGASRSAGPASVYYGLGFAYHLTPTVDVLAQFAEAVGNRSTGSADLWSIGIVAALI